MNNIVVFNSGRLRLMRMLVEGGFNALDGHVTLHLFVNDVTLPPTRTLAELTEATFIGYAPQVLVGALDEGIDSNDSDTWLWPEVAFTSAATPTIPVIAFGYYVTHNDDGELLWGQLFDVPPVWTVAGDSYEIPAQLSLGACCDVTQQPQFELFEFDAALSGSSSHTFEIDADLDFVSAVQFSLDADLVNFAVSRFLIDAVVAGASSHTWSIDATLADQRSETFFLDADVYSIPPDAFFVDAAIAGRPFKLFVVNSVLADQNTQTFSIDADLVGAAGAQFTIDTLVVAQGGVIFRGPGNGIITSPPGITAINVYLWGGGGTGGEDSGGRGGAGGGGGGYLEAISRYTMPGYGLAYGVDDGGAISTTFIALPTSALFATRGSPGFSTGGGAGGVGIGGDFNAFGGDGGDPYSGSTAYFGAGGGAVGDWRGDGDAGQDSPILDAGLGGDPWSAWGGGGTGANPRETVFGHDGFEPGGGGGGGGSFTGHDGNPGGAGGTGWLYITYQAAICWIDAVLMATEAVDFEIDALIEEQVETSFTIAAALANEHAKTFSVDALLGAPQTETFTIDSLLATRGTQTFSVDTLLATRVTRTFSIDACLGAAVTRTFTIDADLAAAFDVLWADDGATVLLADDGDTILIPI